MHTYIHTHTYIHAYIHKYIHTHIHTYIYINIKIAKAYRTVSNEALCIITGLKLIHIKIKETAELYNIGRGNSYKKLQIDHEKPPKNGFTQQKGQ